MFKSKGFLTIFILELVLPWVTGVLGFLAFTNFDASWKFYRDKLMDDYERTNHLFEMFYKATWVYGTILIIVFLLVGLVSLIIALVNMSSKTKVKYSVARPLVIWCCSAAFSIGTLLQMLLTSAFTYGMSV